MQIQLGEKRNKGNETKQGQAVARAGSYFRAGWPNDHPVYVLSGLFGDFFRRFKCDLFSWFLVILPKKGSLRNDATLKKIWRQELPQLSPAHALFANVNRLRSHLQMFTGQEAHSNECTTKFNLHHFFWCLVKHWFWACIATQCWCMLCAWGASSHGFYLSFLMERIPGSRCFLQLQVSGNYIWRHQDDFEGWRWFSLRRSPGCAEKENAGKPIYAAFCAVAVFPPDRMSGCCPWRWIGTQGTPGISQTAPTLLLNTIRLLLHPQPQAHALPPTGSACPFDRRRDAQAAPRPPSHLCSRSWTEAVQISLLVSCTDVTDVSILHWC